MDAFDGSSYEVYMSRGHYSTDKRQREADRARKKLEKAEKRQRKRETGPGEIPITTVEELSGGMRSVEEAMRAMENRSEPRSAATPPCRLFVGGLSWETTVETLRRGFTEHGAVADAVIIRDRSTGDSRGFGFVTMENRKDAARAIEALNDSELDGRRIVVKIASERER